MVFLSCVRSRYRARLDGRPEKVSTSCLRPYDLRVPRPGSPAHAVTHGYCEAIERDRQQPFLQTFVLSNDPTNDVPQRRKIETTMPAAPEPLQSANSSTKRVFGKLNSRRPGVGIGGLLSQISETLFNESHQRRWPILTAGLIVGSSIHHFVERALEPDPAPRIGSAPTVTHVADPRPYLPVEMSASGQNARLLARNSTGCLHLAVAVKLRRIGSTTDVRTGANVYRAFMADNEGLVILTAFIGAVFGGTGCLVAASTGDVGFGALAAIGTVICTLIWYGGLDRRTL